LYICIYISALELPYVLCVCKCKSGPLPVGNAAVTSNLQGADEQFPSLCSEKDSIAVVPTAIPGAVSGAISIAIPRAVSRVAPTSGAVARTVCTAVTKAKIPGAVCRAMRRC